MINFKIPTLKKAHEFLELGEKLNPGRWIDHSKNAGLAAKNIAQKTDNLDPDAAYIMGILHDIGRFDNVKQMAHTIDGYKFMNDEGYPDIARICLTHSFILKDIEMIVSNYDCTSAEKDFIKNFINDVEYNDYDRLIQLCDFLALPSGFCIIEKRIVDVSLRYGSSDKLNRKWKESFKLKKYFDGKTGDSIYKLLPGIAENTLFYDLIF